MRSSTATGTTATADSLPARGQARAAAYRGRFAPSPNGLLHRGSLLATLASWLDARAHGGTWLIRIEDVDAPRVVPGAAARMLETLAQFGLTSDEPVLWQSTRGEAYREALHALVARGLAYRCRCTRGERTEGLPCSCRTKALTGGDCAWRLRLDVERIGFEDGVQGACSVDMREQGDPILFRRDGLPAYQLAVSVDDDFQGITDVVRGADLLESSAWQIAVLRALQRPVPRYMHVPVLTEPGGAKLAKSRRSLPLEGLDVASTLAATLELLGVPVSRELKAAPVSDMLHWSVQNWCAARMRGVRSMVLQD